METRSIATESRSDTLITFFKFKGLKFGNNWSPHTWNGLNSFSGLDIWTDGVNVYYSLSGKSYILNKSTFTWEEKVFNPSNLSFRGSDIWTDGTSIYYSNGSAQYVLNKSTSTWEEKIWYGVEAPNAAYIWKDEENIYYSLSTNQYILNKATSTWEIKTWNGVTGLNGSYVWTDGENVYYTPTTTQSILIKETSTWEKTSLAKIPVSYPSANQIWTDGKNTYYSTTSDQYALNKTTYTWEEKIWDGLPMFHAPYLWTDGTNIYYSNEKEHYILPSESTTIRTLTINGTVTTEWNGKPVKQVTVDGVTYKMPETVEPALIIFMISGIEYQAEEGMTWSEWVASSYNSGGYTESDGKIMRLRKFVYTPAGSVDSSDVIVPNESYTEETGGGTAS